MVVQPYTVKAEPISLNSGIFDGTEIPLLLVYD